mmetsp:Transcript_23891/g.37399  ORF Transcript_23891/g.37399 Transcript_23891/m.37399 type:complete len:249 (-) Transcript_23891:104-850(-)
MEFFHLAALQSQAGASASTDRATSTRLAISSVFADILHTVATAPKFQTDAASPPAASKDHPSQSNLSTAVHPESRSSEYATSMEVVCEAATNACHCTIESEDHVSGASTPVLARTTRAAESDTIPPNPWISELPRALAHLSPIDPESCHLGDSRFPPQWLRPLIPEENLMRFLYDGPGGGDKNLAHIRLKKQDKARRLSLPGAMCTKKPRLESSVQISKPVSWNGHSTAAGAITLEMSHLECPQATIA